MNKRILQTFIFMLITSGLLGLKTNAQTTGSLFMLQDNFRSQMINPSFTRFDNAIVIAIPGFAGATLGNSGNFKFTDILRRQENGEMAVDIEHYYNQGAATTRLTDWSVLPYFFVSFPTKKGHFSFYFKEHVSASIKFNTKAIQFFSEGNQSEQYKSYNTENIQASGLAYRELGVGYAAKKTDELTIGFRGKLLFGVAMADIRDWNFGIKTLENGETLELNSEGKGRLSLPFVDVVDENGDTRNVDFNEGLSEYMKNYRNPGLAFDFGFNYFVSDKGQLSVSVSDLGAIWFQHNAYSVEENSSFNFTGFDLSNSLDNDQTENYIDSYELVYDAKDSIRDVFRPDSDTVNFVKILPPKTVFHYLYETSKRHSLGITNQTVFLHKNILNKLTFSAKQKFGTLSIFESINIHNVNSVSLGGGLQWDASFFQLFFATDNVLAFYHPANQKSFTASFGVSFLLRKQEQKSKDRKGSFSPWRPFYEKKKG